MLKNPLQRLPSHRYQLEGSEVDTEEVQWTAPTPGVRLPDSRPLPAPMTRRPIPVVLDPGVWWTHTQHVQQVCNGLEVVW